MLGEPTFQFLDFCLLVGNWGGVNVYGFKVTHICSQPISGGIQCMQIKLKLTCAEEPVEDVHSGWVGHTHTVASWRRLQILFVSIEQICLSGRRHI